MLCSQKILSDPSVNSYFEDLPPHNVTGEDNLYFFFTKNGHLLFVFHISTPYSQITVSVLLLAIHIYTYDVTY